MKVLLIGGYSLKGEAIGARFYKEGYEIFIIDDNYPNSNIGFNVKHKFYNFNIKDERCEEVFSANSFNYVIYIDKYVSSDKGRATHGGDVRASLELSSKYMVEKFFYLSSLKVYEGIRDLNINEEAKIFNKSIEQINILSNERDCRFWNESTDLIVRVLRVGECYGPGRWDSYLNNIITEIVKAKGNINNNNEDDNVIKDYIYIGDMVDGLYKSVEFSSSFVVNICSGQSFTTGEIKKVVKKVYEDGTQVSIIHKEVEEVSYSNELAKNHLGWNQRYSIDKGIEKTIKWIKENPLQIVNNDDEKKERSNINKFIPYIENILCFVLILILKNVMSNYAIIPIIDLSLVYISIIAIVYGLSQSWISILLSCILFMAEPIGQGQNFFSIIYNPNTLLNISLYIFVGSVLGYIIDSKKIEIKEKQIHILQLQDKFDFIYGVYTDLKEVKVQLESQITTSQDSFGKIYKITNELNSLHVDQIFDKAIGVIKEVIKEDNIALYTISKDSRYLRLISLSKELKKLNVVKKSLSIEENREIEGFVKSKNIFINHGLDSGLPSIMAPIVMDNKAIAAIAVYGIKFENLNLYKQNLLSVLANLVTSSLAKAYQYELAIVENKYIKNTDVLNADYFKELLNFKMKQVEAKNLECTLLKVWLSSTSFNEIYTIIKKQLRDIDYIGMDETNNIYILLNNTNELEANFVVKRLKSQQINTRIVDIAEVVNYSKWNNNLALEEVAATMIETL